MNTSHPEKTDAEMSFFRRLRATFGWCFGGASWLIFLLAAVVWFPLPEAIGKPLAATILGLALIRFVIWYRAFPKHHRYLTEVLPEEARRRDLRDRVYGPIHELGRVLHICSAADLKIPEHYRSAILALIYTHDWGFSIARHEYDPTALEKFGENDRKRLERWVQEYPESVYVLLLALAAGWEEHQAWGMAMNV